ncbi:MAG: HD domain-containing protein [Chloroflexi bacterium]|nr:HD domain-containing protein [Chloroflexota bacterium]
MGDRSSRSDEEEHGYAGRWVARVHGRIVAQGGTPDQALRASQQSRYKEKPEIEFMPLVLPLPDFIDRIPDLIPKNQPIHLVGGAVRDGLLGASSTDFDFVLPSGGISTARKVANKIDGAFFALNEERDTGRVILKRNGDQRILLDFAIYRGGNLAEDLRARDFTIDALAYDLRTHTILDPLEGARDLRAKTIRACSVNSILDDPLRVLRAVRLAASLEFHIEKETRNLMKQAVSQLIRVSPERIRDELFRILGNRRPAASLQALDLLGALDHLLPELLRMKGVTQPLPHIHDVWAHTLAVVSNLEEILDVLRLEYAAEETHDIQTGMLTLKLGRYRTQFADHFRIPLNPNRSNRSLLFFAALYHDVGKPATRSLDASNRIRFFDHETVGVDIAQERAQAFNLSNDETDRLGRVIAHHMRIHSFASRLEGEGKTPSRKAIYRFFRACGEAGVDLILLSLADVRGTRGTNVSQETWTAYLEIARLLLEHYWERPQEVVSPPRLLDGHDLMEILGMKEGPMVGQLLEAIRENQASGKILTREQAIKFAQDLGSDWQSANPLDPEHDHDNL